MKKLAILGLTLVLCLGSAAGCGGSKEETEKENEGYVQDMLDNYHEQQSEQQAEAESKNQEGSDSQMVIKSVDDLLAFRDRVENGEPALEARLEADIDLSEVCGPNKGNWQIISDYNGIFDGNGYTISGLYFVDMETKKVGLFGNVGSDGVIKNLGLEDVCLSGTDHVGAVAGFSLGLVENCWVSGEITGTNQEDVYVGGILGRGQIAEVKNCTNKAAVTCICDTPEDPSGQVGGIAGRMEYSIVTDCVNEGIIRGEGNYTGGITGTMVDEDCTMTGCINYGEVVGYYCAGGMTGLARDLLMDRCGNEGTVEAYIYAGGLAGASSTNSDQYSYIKNSYNHGEVAVTSWDGDWYWGRDLMSEQCAAGLVGYFSKADVINCYNTGTITSQCAERNHFSAGLVGLYETGNEEIFNSYSIGELVAEGEKFGVGIPYYHKLDQVYALEGEPDYTGDMYVDQEWMASFVKPLAAFTDGTVCDALNTYLTSGTAEYSALDTLCGWVQGENGPALDWEE